MICPFVVLPLIDGGLSVSSSSTRARFGAGEGASTAFSSGSRACRLVMVVLSIVRDV